MAGLVTAGAIVCAIALLILTVPVALTVMLERMNAWRESDFRRRADAEPAVPHEDLDLRAIRSTDDSYLSLHH